MTPLSKNIEVFRPKKTFEDSKPEKLRLYKVAQQRGHEIYTKTRINKWVTEQLKTIRTQIVIP
jgi:hypothetical protein